MKEHQPAGSSGARLLRPQWQNVTSPDCIGTTARGRSCPDSVEMADIGRKNRGAPHAGAIRYYSLTSLLHMILCRWQIALRRQRRSAICHVCFCTTLAGESQSTRVQVFIISPNRLALCLPVPLSKMSPSGQIMVLEERKAAYHAVFAGRKPTNDTPQIIRSLYR